MIAKLRLGTKFTLILIAVFLVGVSVGGVVLRKPYKVVRRVR